jgi:putative solute:sodium symporter small subunit
MLNQPPGLQGEAALQSARQQHWRATRRLTGLLLLIWAGLTFGVVFYARSLSFSFFGWPFSFWAAAQGLMGLFLALVVLYAWLMRRLDQRYGLDELD